MNLSFSTRGWQSLGYDAWVSYACEMRFGGIELYNVFEQEELFDKGGALHRYQIAMSLRKLSEKGLCIPCIDSAMDLSDGREETFELLRRQVELADELNCPFVAARAEKGTEEAAAETIRRFLEEDGHERVTLLIRTGGMFADTGRLRSLLDGFASDRLGVLWDVHYPIRDAGESPASRMG